jgi:hypothetical protein
MEEKNRGWRIEDGGSGLIFYKFPNLNFLTVGELHEIHTGWQSPETGMHYVIES